MIPGRNYQPGDQSIPEPYRTIVDRAMARDRQFFEDHPGAGSYTRPYTEGECWPLMHAGPALVRVTELRPGARARELIVPTPGIS